MTTVTTTFVLLSLLTVGVFAQGFAGDQCSQKNSNIGECRLQPECPSARGIPLRQIQRLFNRCGFEGSIPVICCPELSQTIDIPPDVNDNINPDFYFKPDNQVPVGTNTASRLNVRKYHTACTEYTKSFSLRSSDNIVPHILGGENAELGEFPHMVGLGYDLPAGRSYICGGSLISNEWVLTAAHCIYNVYRVQPTVVKMGIVDIKSEETPEIFYNIAEIKVHEKYNRSVKYNDIALLKLDRPVVFSSSLYPACLDTDLNDPTNNVIVTGWGVNTTQRVISPDILQKATLSIVPLSTCNTTFTTDVDRKRSPFGVISTQLCAKDLVNNADTCQGDSGGPLQVRIKLNSIYKIIGLTSFGRACGSSNPAVYTRVSSFLDWIEKHVWP